MVLIRRHKYVNELISGRLALNTIKLSALNVQNVPPSYVSPSRPESVMFHLIQHLPMKDRSAQCALHAKLHYSYVNA